MYSTPEQLVRNLESKIEQNHSEKTQCEILRLEMEHKLFLFFTFQENVEFQISERLFFEENEYEVCAYATVKDCNSIQTTFNFKGCFYTSLNGGIPELSYKGIFQTLSVVMFVRIGRRNSVEENKANANFEFNRNTIETLSREALKIGNESEYEKLCLKRKQNQSVYDRKREKTDKRIDFKNEADKKRNKTEGRLKMNRIIDKKRDQDEARREMHQRIDKERDQDEARRESHKRIYTEKDKERDQKRDQDEARREMHQRIDKERDKERDQDEARRQSHKRIYTEKDKKRDQDEDRIKMHRKLAEDRRRAQEKKVYENSSYIRKYLKSIDTDTGFNVICVCCAEYKSRYACTGIQVLSEQQQRKYLIRNDRKLISKDGKKYICKSCRGQIEAKKVPKKSEKDQHKTSEIPFFFKKKLKKIYRLCQST